jgi:hypothetical protein
MLAYFEWNFVSSLANFDSVLKVQQLGGRCGGHGMLVMFNVTDP